jgi:hypothetical protein
VIGLNISAWRMLELCIDAPTIPLVAVVLPRVPEPRTGGLVPPFSTLNDGYDDPHEDGRREQKLLCRGHCAWRGQGTQSSSRILQRSIPNVNNRRGCNGSFAEEQISATAMAAVSTKIMSLHRRRARPFLVKCYAFGP